MPALAPYPSVPMDAVRTPGETTPTVLVVDDEPAVRQLLRVGLELHGFRVLCAATEDEALALFRDNAAVVTHALIDHRLGEADGTETLSRLRGLAPGLPCWVMSGDGLAERYAEAPESVPGARGVIGKPFRLGELADLLRETGPDDLS